MIFKRGSGSVVTEGGETNLAGGGGGEGGGGEGGGGEGGEAETGFALRSIKRIPS